MKTIISSILAILFLAPISSCSTNALKPDVHESSCLDELTDLEAFHVKVHYFNGGYLVPFPCEGAFDFRFSDGDVGQEHTKYVLQNFDRKSALIFYAKITVSGVEPGELRDKLIVSSFEITGDAADPWLVESAN